MNWSDHRCFLVIIAYLVMMLALVSFILRK